MRRGEISYRYDPELDPATWKGTKPYFANPNLPKWKRELQEDKSRKGVRASQGVQKARQQAKTREALELQAEELVRRVASALEMMLHQLMETPAPSTYHRVINQHQLYNVLVSLKTKCGVKFDDEFAHEKVPLAPSSSEGERKQEAEYKRIMKEEQRQQRNLALRREAERFKNWKKSNAK